MTVLEQATAEVDAEERRAKVEAAKQRIRERRGRPWWSTLIPFRIRLERI